MLRSLFAVIVAVIAGLGAAKFLEGGLVAVSGAQRDDGAYSLILAASWFLGAFVAASLALWLGRRWAPIGGLAAGTIFFSAFMTMLPGTLGWWLWPASAIVTALGGWLALRLGGAKAAPTGARKTEDIFPDE
ncbi:MAG: hypothetical protein ACX939_13280 [Hyphococcus sp.]